MIPFSQTSNWSGTFFCCFLQQTGSSKISGFQKFQRKLFVNYVFFLLPSIMKKTFWYLLFMVIFLPTFGFTTAQASIEFLWNTNKNDTYRWECIFLPDSGAFFVNYVTTAALVGAGLELIRFPDLFWYFIQICWSRSRAENPAIQRNIRYEFRFGEYSGNALGIWICGCRCILESSGYQNSGCT